MPSNPITGTNGNDTITGTTGDDTISPLRGQDTVNGGAGNDLLIVDYSSNAYTGTTTYAAGITSNIYISGGAWYGNITAYTNSSGNYDQVNFSNIESLQITGTAANDTFDEGGYGSITIDGGAGIDTINYADFSSFTTNLTVDNSGGTFTESNGTVVKNVERFKNITTGTGNDTITFTGSFDETINTGVGDDTINVGRGYDNVDGGAGNDLLIVDYSSNTYTGTTTYAAGITSNIYISGGAWYGSFRANTNSSGNYDYISFSNIESLQITGTAANDTFDEGGYGSITIDGGAGIDTINYADFSSFTTNLTVDNSGGTFTESNGTVVKNVERFKNITTGTGNDTITFTGSFDETINTGVGDDTINVGRGYDNVDGGAGNDLLIVDYSSNTYTGTTTYAAGITSSIGISGGAWYGSFRANTASSGTYDQVSFSNIESLQITGTAANDTFDRGGYGSITIDGGAGIDTINNADFSSFTTNLTVDNSGGTFTESNGTVVKNVERFKNITTGTGNDTITFTGSFDETINTGVGDDTINVGRGYDNVNGGAGNDLLIVDYSSNTYTGTTTYAAGITSSIGISGGAWYGSFRANTASSGTYDQVSFSNIESLQITGTAANDTFDEGGYGSITIDGGAGIDTINYADFSSFTTNLTVDNSGGTFTESNGTVVKNVERFKNITTGTGNDTITFTGSFDETINTGVGDDTINVGRGYDNVDGGAGNDLLIVDYSSNTYTGTTTYAAGITSNIYISGGAWYGSFRANTNSSGNYDYISFSNIESLQITGTAANDTFDEGGYGSITIDGGAGIDTINYADFSSFTTNLTVDNSGGTFTESNGTVVKNVERFKNITTGTGNDTITFTGSFDETINTGVGDDTINVGRGYDNVDGGAGNDLLIVDYSSNTYTGTTTYAAGITSSIGISGGAWYGSFRANTNSSGNYDYISFSNIESLQITGTAANDTFDRGGYGSITIDGGAGIDTINNADFSSFTTNLTVDNSGGTFTESNGTVVKNVERFKNITTGTGNDTITFTGSFNETINTGAGDDTINVGKGYDNVNGGAGNDLLIVDYSSNTYTGTTTYAAGITSNIGISAGAWSGTLYANTDSSGNYDYISFSNIERLQITGTAANDTFDEGGYGSITIDGGAGIDTINYADFSSFTTNLTVDNSGGTFTESNGTVVKNVERFNNLTTGTGNDTITFTGSFNETINTGAGNDIISAGRGQDSVNGGAGNDLLIVDYSSNAYTGTTTYAAGITSSIGISGGAWYGSFRANTASSGTYDQVSFSNIERFQITGTAANDTITTGGGNDIIIGVNPNSATPGKGEIDILTGGAGSDRFILGDFNWMGYDDGLSNNAGTNDYAQITDFNTSEGDIIQLKGVSTDYLLVVSGADTQIFIDKPGAEPDELIGIIKNRTGLSLTANYFAYNQPSISLTVAPSSVLEDGATNLVYTFTRTGDFTNSLTVNFGIAGSATFNTDYTQAGAATFNGTTGTITFAANANTATLTIDPTPDFSVEADETIALTLTTGTGYILGTTTAITGTITNDDIANQAPTDITLSKNTIAENSALNSLVGNFSSADPNALNTFTYSLVAGTGDSDNDLFTIQNNQLQTNAIFDYENNNTYSIRVRTTDQGNLSYEKSLTINITDVNETPTNITLSNNTINENQPIGTTVGTLNTIDPDQGNTFTYRLINGAGATDNALFTIQNNQLQSNAIFDYETKNSYSIRVRTIDQGRALYDKQLTINIGDLPESYTAVESAGNTKLVTDTTNKYFTQVGTNTPTAIKNGGQQIYQDIYGSGWQTIAAETVNGVNQVLWKNVSGNYLHIWSLDSNWNWVSSQGNWGLNSADALTQENNFAIDANGDGVIGNPYTAIESAGNTKLVKDATNKYFTQIGTNTPIAIKNGGQQIYQDIYGSGWQTIAAETVNGDNQVLWKNVSGNYLHIWHLDNNWNWVSSEGNWGLNSADAFTQETNFGIDANGDGIIGNPYTAIESAGNTKLVKDATNKYFTQIGTNTPTAIKNGGQQIYQDIYGSGWQTIAAETVNGDNQVLWKNISGNFLHIWNLDSNWNWASSQGNWGLNSAEALTQETIFGIDANSDGVIGNPSSLTLTGTSANDFLVGGANNDLLTGAGGKDTLTGGLGADKFVYQNFTDSLLANFDVITDFNATTGNDLFRVSTARAGFVNVGAVNTLDAAGMVAKLTAAAFGSNFAAQFSFGQKTFVAINDATAGFNAATDAIIEVTGLTGTLNVNNFVIV